LARTEKERETYGFGSEILGLSSELGVGGGVATLEEAAGDAGWLVVAGGFMQARLLLAGAEEEEQQLGGAWSKVSRVAAGGAPRGDDFDGWWTWTWHGAEADGVR